MWETWVQFLGWEDLVEKGMQPIPVFLPGEFHGQRSLTSPSPWGLIESDTTEWLTHTFLFRAFCPCPTYLNKKMRGFDFLSSRWILSRRHSFHMKLNFSLSTLPLPCAECTFVLLVTYLSSLSPSLRGSTPRSLLRYVGTVLENRIPVKTRKKYVRVSLTWRGVK